MFVQVAEVLQAVVLANGSGYGTVTGSGSGNGYYSGFGRGDSCNSIRRASLESFVLRAMQQQKQQSQQQQQQLSRTRHVSAAATTASEAAESRELQQHWHVHRSYHVRMPHSGSNYHIGSPDVCGVSAAAAATGSEAANASGLELRVPSARPILKRKSEQHVFQQQSPHWSPQYPYPHRYHFSTQQRSVMWPGWQEERKEYMHEQQQCQLEQQHQSYPYNQGSTPTPPLPSLTGRYDPSHDNSPSTTFRPHPSPARLAGRRSITDVRQTAEIAASYRGPSMSDGVIPVLNEAFEAAATADATAAAAAMRPPPSTISASMRSALSFDAAAAAPAIELTFAGRTGRVSITRTHPNDVSGNLNVHSSL